MTSRLYEALGPKMRVTGVSSRPGSGISVWYPSATPAGAAMWLVVQGLARWLTCRAIHQKPQT